MFISLPCITLHKETYIDYEQNKETTMTSKLMILSAYSYVKSWHNACCQKMECDWFCSSFLDFCKATYIAIDLSTQQLSSYLPHDLGINTCLYNNAFYLLTAHGEEYKFILPTAE